MAANQPPWPREWLMTDERMAEALWEAIDALPEGAGVVFRHFATIEREELGARVAQACRRRALMLAVAGDVGMAKRLGATLVHNPASDPEGLPFSRSAHSREEAAAACEAGASLVFLSPVFPTRSHPGREPLDREEAKAIVAASEVPVIALGGVTRERSADLERDGFYGWAGIDAWLSAGPSRE